MHDKNALIPQVLVLLQGGTAEMTAVQSLGVDYSTWWDWKQVDPKLQDRVDLAKRARIAILEDSIYRAGALGDWRAAVVWLEKHDKGWRDRLKDAAGNRNTLIFNGRAAELFEMLSIENKQKLLNYIEELGIDGTKPDINGVEGGAQV